MRGFNAPLRDLMISEQEKIGQAIKELVKLNPGMTASKAADVIFLVANGNIAVSANGTSSK